MSRIRLNRPEYGLAHLTAETEENKNISIPLIYKQDITGTFLPAFLNYKKAKPGKGQILLSIYEEDGLGWLIAVDRDIVYFLNKDTKEVYTVARGGSYFIRIYDLPELSTLSRKHTRQTAFSNSVHSAYDRE